MPELIVLGTASSVPDAKHDTVGLLLRGPGWAIPIDCGGSPLHKLARCGVVGGQVSALVFTHCHADHMYGFPMLVQGLWLSGREAPLPVYGPVEALGVARGLLDLFRLTDAAESFPITWHHFSAHQGGRVLEQGGVRIRSTPVVHGSVQTFALRIDNLATGRSVVYSSDTEPCQALIKLAAGAEVLIHEASGALSGHSSPAQAAEVGRAAGAAELILIHYPVVGVDLRAWRSRASGFPGPVRLAADGDVLAL